MSKVVGVKFETTPKIYTFLAGEFKYTEKMQVVVETARGLEVGEVRMLPKEIPDSELILPLKSVIRIATEADLKKVEENNVKKAETIKTASELADARNLGMKFVDCKYTIDGQKLVLFYIADSRVDFRELVKDLAGKFRLRIELRQIGARDECKMIGGYGPCGRQCCCVLGCEQNKVNIRMAKNQGLSLNPGKISGMCGRLMCCLAFENDYYAEVNRAMPKINSTVKIRQEDGSYTEGTVISINQLAMSVRCRTCVKDDTYEINDYLLSDIVPRIKNEIEVDENDDSDQLKDE